jgi:hypothetical protein
MSQVIKDLFGSFGIFSLALLTAGAILFASSFFFRGRQPGVPVNT